VSAVVVELVRWEMEMEIELRARSCERERQSYIKSCFIF
jgi:hypothetical protein